jgi:hypothetical protein
MFYISSKISVKWQNLSKHFSVRARLIVSIVYMYIPIRDADPSNFSILILIPILALWDYLILIQELRFLRIFRGQTNDKFPFYTTCLLIFGKKMGFVYERFSESVKPI